MPSSGTLRVAGVVLLAAAGASYLRLLGNLDAPLRAMAGVSYPYFLLLAALVGFACLAGSFFGSANA
ncbi:MAG: hypothetical protein KGH63_03270 [Candidatus Micrarchaeota archaeon]|nr:hypothetical protein [Candidatus Micrarchaeota archaeon]